ncbi:MAG: hypothetical protein ABFD16_09465 [Thermoguttaceae bacterium]
MKISVGAGAVLLLLSAGLLAQAEPPAGNDSFLGQLRVGQRVMLAEANGGFVLVVGEDTPVWLTLDSGQRAVLQAEAVRRIIVTEYQQALAANQRVPNTIPGPQVEQLRTRVAQANREVEQAQQQARRPEVWEVFVVGNDYVGLRSGGTEMRIPLMSIRVLLQQTAPAKSSPTG